MSNIKAYRTQKKPKPKCPQAKRLVLKDLAKIILTKVRKHSEETKAKMRASRAKRIYTDEDKMKIS